MYPYYYQNGDRYFVVPFLVGALAGGAAVGVTRPRPIVANYPNQNPYPYYNSYYYGGYNPYFNRF